MSISVFDLFSIGIGPSSSHTVGPMRAAKQFLTDDITDVTCVHSITVTVYGSLAFTGHGHGTDKAILLGLMGFDPETVELSQIPSWLQSIKTNQQLNLLQSHRISFNQDQQLCFDKHTQDPHHSNAMHFQATLNDGSVIESRYYSIGGGFISKGENTPLTQDSTIPYPFSTAAELLDVCDTHNLSIAEVMLANEQTWRSKDEIDHQLDRIYNTMTDCIERGCNTAGFLEGPMQVKRRAPDLYKKLSQNGLPSPQHPNRMSWLNVFAIAVNEENAAGGRVVTAPTNGAAGIIPAVLYYYETCLRGHREGIRAFLLTAAAIGFLYKEKASISGAEMGCQGEVGVACSMAAGGLAAALGGTLMQIENAAEIGMEHNLGLTCDPVGGRVQIPCIERNAMGALKAVNAADLALAGDGTHHVSLDAVIKTMFEIGSNMNSIYKETSKGGLAVNVPEC